LQAVEGKEEGRMEFALTARVQGNIDEVEVKITSALRDAGFGILTPIEVDKVLKDKIEVEIPPYRILGACNPQLVSGTDDEAGSRCVSAVFSLLSSGERALFPFGRSISAPWWKHWKIRICHLMGHWQEV
jgi:hypothetical protein